jgi:hypothetical protein
MVSVGWFVGGDEWDGQENLFRKRIAFFKFCALIRVSRDRLR